MLRLRCGALPSVLLTNAAIAAIAVGLGLWLGFAELLMIHGPIVVVSSFLGVWLFYVQHQFEETHWAEEGNWDFFKAGMDEAA